MLTESSCWPSLNQGSHRSSTFIGFCTQNDAGAEAALNPVHWVVSLLPGLRSDKSRVWKVRRECNDAEFVPDHNRYDGDSPMVIG